MRVRIAIGLVTLAVVSPAHAQEPGPQAPAPAPPASQDPPRTPRLERLSELGHTSRWAFVLRKAIARKTPDPRAKAVARLRLKTQDGTDELVAVLARTTDEAGRTWIRVRLPILPNNSTGWVSDDALGRFHRVRTWLRIDTKRLQAKLIRAGRLVFRSRIGIGQKRWPTPKGQFYIRDRLQGFPPGGIYGAMAFGLNARSSVLTDWPGGGFVGIHGTNQPYLLPGRVSHGCIRMRNRDILRLARLMRVGTPVTIY
ncbi:MAG TPA: L,D-transpeptidase [Gemmatimonadales bacterium]|nr:L,D-transpeptidase [Gemmatimonadales bacterium]